MQHSNNEFDIKETEEIKPQFDESKIQKSKEDKKKDKKIKKDKKDKKVRDRKGSMSSDGDVLGDISSKVQEKDRVKLFKKKPKKVEKQKKVDSDSSDCEQNTEEKSKIYEETKRGFTLSMVIPSSIVDNAQSMELKTYLVGQIAKAATIFGI